MNDPVVKVALTISILIGGVFIAIVFKPIFSAAIAPNAQINTPLNLQHPSQIYISNPDQTIATASLSKAEKNILQQTPTPTVLAPLDQTQPVPDLPTHYPSDTSTNGARWGMPMNMMPVVARPTEGPIIHKIVDGDSLANLATRYLGSSKRAGEIFNANRDVLTDPGFLTIGTELKIPSAK